GSEAGDWSKRSATRERCHEVERILRHPPLMAGEVKLLSCRSVALERQLEAPRRVVGLAGAVPECEPMPGEAKVDRVAIGGAKVEWRQLLHAADPEVRRKQRG